MPTAHCSISYTNFGENSKILRSNNCADEAFSVILANGLQVFEAETGIKPRKKGDLLHMLEVLNVAHVGHYHSGIGTPSPPLLSVLQN